MGQTVDASIKIGKTLINFHAEKQEINLEIATDSDNIFVTNKRTVFVTQEAFKDSKQSIDRIVFAYTMFVQTVCSINSYGPLSEAYCDTLVQITTQVSDCDSTRPHHKYLHQHIMKY